MPTIDIEKLAELLPDVDDRIKREIYPDYDMKNILDVLTLLGKRIDERFVIDGNNKIFYEQMIKWLFCDKTMTCVNPTKKTRMRGRLNRGLYISGATGTGKSLAMKLLGAMAHVMGLHYRLGNKGQKYSYSILTYRADEIVSKYTHGDMLDDIIKTPMLCINDLGTESSEALYMGNRTDVIRTLLERRGDNDRTLTFITSNIPLYDNALAGKYGDRVVSRLFEMCNYLPLKGNDRRINF